MPEDRPRLLKLLEHADLYLRDEVQVALQPDLDPGVVADWPRRRGAARRSWTPPTRASASLPTELPITALREFYETSVFGVVAATNAMLPLIRKVGGRLHRQRL